MKKLFVFAVAMLLCAGMVYAAPATNNDGPGDILGQGKLDSQPGKIFRLVRYVANALTPNTPTLTIDSVVVWDTTSDDGVTVTTTTTSGDSRVAGIAVAAILTSDMNCGHNTATQDIGHRNWGWIQTYGLSKANFDSDATMDVGDSIAPSGTNGLVAGWPPAAGHTKTSNGKMGFAVSAVTAAATVQPVFLSGLD